MPTDKEGESDLQRSHEDFLIQEYIFGKRPELQEYVDAILEKQSREVWVEGEGWVEKDLPLTM